MWRIAGRTAGVFASWGLVLIIAIGGGIHAHLAETLCACGAGCSLVLWGLSLARDQRRLEAVTNNATAREEKERASV